MLRGRKGRDLCVTDSPPTETIDRLVLVVPPGAFSQLTEVALDKESARLRSVVMTGLSSWLLLLYDARLSVDRKSCCRVRGAVSSRIVSSEQLLV